MEGGEGEGRREGGEERGERRMEGYGNMKGRAWERG